MCYLIEEFDTYIIVSFTNATLVLSIGETVEEVTDSGFLGTTPTIACSRVGEDALIQVGGLIRNEMSLMCVYACLCRCTLRVSATSEQTNV